MSTEKPAIHEGLNYRVIKKRDMPEPKARHNKRLGEWMALARLLRYLAPDEAVELRIPDGASPATVVSSLHGAADAVGVEVSTMTVGASIYLVRKRITEPRPRFGLNVVKINCRYCGAEVETTRSWRKVCCREECQAKRRRDIGAAWKLREEAKKGV